MTSFIDTHCHLDKLDLSPAEAIHEAIQVGVNKMITISVDETSLSFVSSIVEKFAGVYGSVGFHPHDASSFTELHEKKIIDLANENVKIIAIGETGLDYYYMNSPPEVQKEVFLKHIQIAKITNLPLVLHTREAESDTMDILEGFSNIPKGVAHSFTGSKKMAKKLVEMGWYIGINGIVTFKNAEELRELVNWLPLDSLLLETDSPFLSPVPFRGRPNKPSNIPTIASFIAELKNIPLENLAEKTSKNAQKIFKF